MNRHERRAEEVKRARQRRALDRLLVTIKPVGSAAADVTDAAREAHRSGALTTDQARALGVVVC